MVKVYPKSEQSTLIIVFIKYNTSSFLLAFSSILHHQFYSYLYHSGMERGWERLQGRENILRENLF